MTGSAGKSGPLLVLLVACRFFAFSRAGGTPAVIWCPHNDSEYDSQPKTTRSNPLVKLSSEDFEESLSQLSATDTAVIVADELCVEDLKNNKVLLLAINGSKVYYYPRVVMPDVVFKKLFSTGQVKMIEDVNDNHELNMVLKDTDSSRCVALTGKQCRYSERIKRDTAGEAKDDKDKDEDFRIKTDRVLFYAAKPLSFKPKNKEKYVELPQSKVTSSSTRTMPNRTVILNIKFADVEEIGDLVLEFLFPVKSVGYYTLEKVNSEEKSTVNAVLFTERDITFPYNFSYHCSPEIVFTNKETVLNISGIQVEIDHKKGVFSDAYDCVGFTSIPIWTAIFVNALLIFILTWALVMIMDIKTMDRFDDPKGKTITISTAE